MTAADVERAVVAAVVVAVRPLLLLLLNIRLQVLTMMSQMTVTF